MKKLGGGGGGGQRSLSLPRCLASGRFCLSSFSIRPLFYITSLPFSYLLDLGVRAGVDGRGADGDDGAARGGDGLERW